jgi:Bacterial antitoxin of type II TA system, VapB
VKTTLDIQDVLLQRAKRLSKRTGKPLRALVEEGLRHVLSEQRTHSARYELPDCSVGDVNATNPLENWSWQDLRDEIYGDPTQR